MLIISDKESKDARVDKGFGIRSEKRVKYVCAFILGANAISSLGL
jgi:hypothetical protein